MYEFESETKIESVPIYRKINLTIDEAAEYSNIGRTKIREMIKQPCCPYVLYVGSKALIKREAFEKYLSGINSV